MRKKPHVLYVNIIVFLILGFILKEFSQVLGKAYRVKVIVQAVFLLVIGLVDSYATPGESKEDRAFARQVNQHFRNPALLRALRPILVKIESAFRNLVQPL